MTLFSSRLLALWLLDGRLGRTPAPPLRLGGCILARPSVADPTAAPCAPLFAIAGLTPPLRGLCLPLSRSHSGPLPACAPSHPRPRTACPPSHSQVLKLKEKIEAAKGEAYFASGLKVIFSGKVLKDDDTLEAHNFKEGGFVVVMPGKVGAQAS